MAAPVNLMFCLVPNATFGATPSGQTYVSRPLGGTTYGVIYNVNPIDVAFLGQAGCNNAIPFNNPAASRAPVATDDYTQGYNVGSTWNFINGSLSTVYLCSGMGTTPGQATWVLATGTTGLTGPQGPTGPQGASGITPEGAYSSTLTYAQFQGVTYSGTAYVSLQNGNLNNTPSSSPSWWQAVGLVATPPTLDIFAPAGQSNAVGTAADPTLSPQVPVGVYQYNGSAIVAGNDPVGDANPSSAWPAFGIEYFRRTGRPICFAGLPVGGTDQCATTGASTQNWDTSSVGSWGSTATLAPALIANIAAAMTAAKNAGWSPVFRGILWSQGENDAGIIGNSGSYPNEGVTEVTGGPYAAGTTAITVSSGTGLATGQSAVISLTAGSTFTSVITVSGTNVTLATPVPSGQTIPTGAYFHIFSEDDYQQGFERMAAYFRSQAINGVTYPELPIFISQTGGPGSGDQLGYQRVRQAQERICQNDPYTTIAFRGAVDFIARGLMQNPAATFTASAVSGVMTVSNVSAGQVLPYWNLSGAGVSANTSVEAIGTGGTTGVGGKGTYAITPSQSFGSTTVTESGSVLHYRQEAYNEMGREMAKGVLGINPSLVPQMYNVIRLYLGGSLTTSDAVTLTLTSSAISGSPWSVGPTTVVGGDTFATFAARLVQNLTSFSPNLSAAGVFADYQATSWGVIVSIYQPQSLSPQATMTASWTGSGTETFNISTGQSAYGRSADVLMNKGNLTVGGTGAPGPDFFNVLGPTSGPTLTLGTNTFVAGLINSVAAGSDNNVLRLGNSIASDISDQRVGIIFQPDMNLFTENGALYGGAIISSNDGVNGRTNIEIGGYSAGTWIEHARFTYTGGLSLGTTTDPGSGNARINGFLETNFGTATPAGGNAAAGILLGTAGIGLYWGSGAPTLSAVQGSLYLRSDGSSTSTRLYVCEGGTSWTNFTSAA